MDTGRTRKLRGLVCGDMELKQNSSSADPVESTQKPLPCSETIQIKKIVKHWPLFNYFFNSTGLVP